VLAPRHPERFVAVAGSVAAAGLPWARRTDRPERFSGGVLLLDTIGELAAVYSLGAIAFVGGSLLAGGGHNLLEPAQHGVAVLTGPHTENFRDLVADFQAGGGVRVVEAAELAAVLVHLLADAEERNTLGRRARELFAARPGATERTVRALRELVRKAEPAGDEVRA
jgi:3-deoxy-D-manno-octulosonic-acid transferase